MKQLNLHQVKSLTIGEAVTEKLPSGKPYQTKAIKVWDEKGDKFEINLYFSDEAIKNG